jgi:hypothetical protein
MLVPAHLDRVRSALSLAGTSLNLLECGCGGAPGRDLVGLCSRCTGVDFSYRGCEFRNKSPTDSEMMLPTYSD